MSFANKLIRSIVILAACCVLLTGGSAHAQPCGRNMLTVRVGDEEGAPVKNVTVELLEPKSMERLNVKSIPAKQIGSEPQSEFMFGVGFGMGSQLLRVTAPGYFRYEESGKLITGCHNYMDVVLINRSAVMPEGVPPPSIVGTVRDVTINSIHGFMADDFNQGRPKSGTPLQGIDVVAVKDKKEFRATTDEKGRYKFEQLPVGNYIVYPVLPKTLALRNSWGGLLEREGILVGVTKNPDPVRLDFTGIPNGSISGKVEVEIEYGTGEVATWVYLRRVQPDSKETAVFPAIQSAELSTDSGSNTGPKEVISFKFDALPPGQYVIECHFTVRLAELPKYNKAPLFYYPGVDALKNAQVIDLAAGDRLTGLVIKPPIVRKARIFGRVTMADGAPVQATVFLTDPTDTDEPSRTLEGGITATTDDGRFEFRLLKGVEFYIYAVYDGEKDGQPVRYFSRSQKLSVTGDLGPIAVTLDQIERSK